MRFSSAAILLATASFAAAQSTACAAQNIVDACLSTTSIRKDACAPNDWQCLCDAWTTILTCYNNCPGTTDRVGAANTQVSFCNAAAAYASTTTTATSSAASSAASGSTSASATTSTTTRASSSAAASSTAKANAAAGYGPAVGGVLGFVVGVVGLL